MNAETFQAFAKHAAGGPDTPNDYFATKLAVMRMFPKLAMGLDSHALLAQSLYHHNGGNEVARVALANPAHKAGLLGGVKNIAPAVGGVRATGSNPLRAVASGVLHSKLANYVTDVARRASQAGKLRPPASACIGANGNPALKASIQQALKQKLASPFLHPGVELAGLGMLGAPVAKTLRDPQVSAKERSHAKWEAAGLGTLGAVSGHELWQAARKPIATAASHL